jgi:hypothetical protein
MHRFLQQPPHYLIEAVSMTAILSAKSCVWLRTGTPKNMRSDADLSCCFTLLLAVLLLALAALPKISMIASQKTDCDSVDRDNQGSVGRASRWRADPALLNSVGGRPIL